MWTTTNCLRKQVLSHTLYATDIVEGKAQKRWIHISGMTGVSIRMQKSVTERAKHYVWCPNNYVIPGFVHFYQPQNIIIQVTSAGFELRV